MAKVDLYSPLAPEECVDRLRAVVSNPDSEVAGRVEHDRLWLRNQIFMPNSFQTFLRAKLIPEGGGTRLRGSVGMSPFVTWSMAFWFVVLGIVSVLSVVNGVVFPLRVIPIVMILFSAFVAWFGRLMSRGQDRFLLEFVTAAIEAKPVVVK